MRTVVPYVTLWPETQAALEADGRQAEYVFVGGSATAYFELLQALWQEGQGFVVVEQDIVPGLGAIAEMESCPEPWCGRPYNMGGSIEPALGCTRFSDALVHDAPGVIEAITRLPFDGITDRRHWGRLDSRLKQVLEDQLGLKHHWHWPAVEHLNPDKKRFTANCVRCGDPIPWATILLSPPPYRCHCED
jgi:hypothetical protein